MSEITRAISASGNHARIALPVAVACNAAILRNSSASRMPLPRLTTTGRPRLRRNLQETTESAEPPERWRSHAPARAFGLRAGTLEIGALADFTLIAPELAWKPELRDLCSRSKNSPFLHCELIGRVVGTFVAGERVFELETGS